MWALFKAAGVLVCMMDCYLEVKIVYRLCSAHFVWIGYKIQLYEGAPGPSASRELPHNTNCAPGEFVITLEGLWKSRVQGNVQGGGPRPEITFWLSILSNLLRHKAIPGTESDIWISCEARDRSVSPPAYRENYVIHKGGLLLRSNRRSSRYALISLKHWDAPVATL